MTTKTTSTERDPQTSAIIAAAIEVHRTLGRGFLEYVYRTPLELEMIDRGIPFKREVYYPIVYKGKPTGIAFRADLVCYGEVIVELKAVKDLTGAERAQAINYLRASGLKRALLLNFGTPVLNLDLSTFLSNPRRDEPLVERRSNAGQTAFHVTRLRMTVTLVMRVTASQANLMCRGLPHLPESAQAQGIGPTAHPSRSASRAAG